MKKLYFLFFIALSFISCDSDHSETAQTQSDKLARVDFRPGLAGERRWIFNSNELLTEITTADGTPVEKFTYDTQSRVIQNTTYNSNGTVNNTYNITYDTGGFIDQINGNGYNYSYYDHKYLYVNGFNTLICRLGSNNLLQQLQNIYNDTVDQHVTSYNCNYNTGGNLTSYFSQGIAIGNSERSYTYDNRTNPIKRGILSILKAKSIYDPQFFIDGNSSTNNIATMNYANDDFENETYTYTYNSYNLPVTQTKSHFNGGVLQNTYVSAKYYYQGDILP